MKPKSKYGSYSDLTELPEEYINKFTLPIARFFKIHTAAGAILLLFTALSFLLANTPLHATIEEFWNVTVGFNIGNLIYERTLHHWINDALMTLFFFLIALELKRELVLGELRSPRLALLSISAAAGGMLLPALIYLALLVDKEGQPGWGTVMATDTAFVIGCLALLGKKIPKSLRVFMLSLAVVDDLGAILVVAFGYGSDINWLAIFIALLLVLIVRFMGYLGIRSIGLFFMIGSLLWVAIDFSGIHPTVTGVILGLMTPTYKWISEKNFHSILDKMASYPPGKYWSGEIKNRRALKTMEAAAREALSPVERLELMLHPWVGFFIMPLFAFANAGVPLAGGNFIPSISLAIFLSLAVGKPLGILMFSWVATRVRLAVLPEDLTWKMVFGGGILAGIGFTMAIFITNLAFQPDQVNSAKIGILLASIFCASFGLLFLHKYGKK